MEVTKNVFRTTFLEQKLLEQNKLETKIRANIVRTKNVITKVV